MKSQESSAASGGIQAMKWVVIGVPALALAGACGGGEAQALPAVSLRTVLTAPPSPLFRPTTYGSGEVKPGQWEFTARLRTSAESPPEGIQSPQGTEAPGEGDPTFILCIDPDKAVPDPLGAQCQLDSRARKGPRITWSMTCRNSDGAVRSDGVAQYHGDTMDATLINHFPDASGRVRDLTQRITGRYLGSCTQAAEAAAIPPRPNAPAQPVPPAPPGSSAQGATPPAASGSTAPPATASIEPPAAAGPPAASPDTQPAPRRRYAQHRHYAYRHYYGRRYYGPGIWPFGFLRLPFIGGL